MRFSRRLSPPDRRAARLVGRTVAIRLLPVGPLDLASGAGMQALRDALRSQTASSPSPISDPLAESAAAVRARLFESPALRQAARLLAGEARAVDAVRAERLLIALKSVWAALPEAQLLPLGGPREAFWDELVARCVAEFYSPSLAPATPAETTAVA